MDNNIQGFDHIQEYWNLFIHFPLCMLKYPRYVYLCCLRRRLWYLMWLQQHYMVAVENNVALNYSGLGSLVSANIGFDWASHLIDSKGREGDS